MLIRDRIECAGICLLILNFNGIKKSRCSYGENKCKRAKIIITGIDRILEKFRQIGSSAVDNNPINRRHTSLPKSFLCCDVQTKHACGVVGPPGKWMRAHGMNWDRISWVSERTGHVVYKNIICFCKKFHQNSAVHFKNLFLVYPEVTLGSPMLNRA